MKHYKKMMLLIYGALLLICIGIVWLLGALNRQGNTENNRESTVQEDTSQAGENQNENGTFGTENGAGLDETGNGLDESEEYEAEHNTKETEIEEKPYEPPTLMLASDLHYMSSTTHDDGKAFRSMVEHDDGKLDQYSDEMLDTLVETAIENHPTALALTGDITLNGERINHELLAEKLQKVQMQTFRCW